MAVIGCKPPAAKAFGSPVSTGSIPGGMPRYGRECGELSPNVGGTAEEVFRPFGDDGLIFLPL